MKDIVSFGYVMRKGTALAVSYCIVISKFGSIFSFNVEYHCMGYQFYNFNVIFLEKKL